jgi:putative transposase
MPRRYRIVVAGKPHHVIQRGNRRQKVFFYPADKTLYLQFLKEQIKKHDVEIWAYCLMDNHVHLVLVPNTIEGLAKAVAETNRCFACMINKRYGWRGYLWQGRFISFVMDEIYLIRTLRYVENNPVRAKIVEKAWDYPWSSARKHVKEAEDALVAECPAVLLIGNWKDYLMRPEVDDILNEIRKRNLSGLPLGGTDFIEKLASDHGLKPSDLMPKAVGRPKKI